MRKRILTGTILLWALAITVATLVASLILQLKLTQESAEDLRNTVQVLAANIEPETIDDFAAEAKELSWQTGGLRVSILSPEGKPLGDSDSTYDVSQYQDVDLFNRVELQQARDTGTGFSTRRSEALGKRMMFAVARTEQGYYIRIATTAASFREGLTSVLIPLLLGLSVATLVSVPAVIRFANKIGNPITELSESLGQVMEGGTKLKPEEFPIPELQKMAVDINALSNKVDTGLLRLEREHQKLEAILGNMNEGFVMLDSDDNLLLINQTACHIFGCVLPETGRHFNEISRNILLWDAVKNVKQTGQVSRIEIESADGGVYEVTVGATRPDEGGITGGTILLLSDVTEKRSTAKMRQEFFQSASHELKTPITSIRGFAELLSSGTFTDPERMHECAERINKEARRMQNLIEDIMMISRLESGEIMYDRKMIDIHEVVQDYCDDMRRMAWDYNIELTYEGESHEMSASRRELEDLAGNLISNALKYNKIGGRIEVRLFHENGYPVLTVFNTGDAIPESEKDRIFERFYRLDKGRSKSLAGTGLGLAIVKHVANRYGATVTVIPQEEVGNTFRVAFSDEPKPLH